MLKEELPSGELEWLSCTSSVGNGNGSGRERYGCSVCAVAVGSGTTSGSEFSFTRGPILGCTSFLLDRVGSMVW